MNARDSIDIATAALRWHTARERRLAAGAEKRCADMLSRSAFLGATNSIRADAVLAECRRQERAAVRALTRACAKTRDDLQATDVLDFTDAGATRLPQATTGTDEGRGRSAPANLCRLGNPTVPHVQKISPRMNTLTSGSDPLSKDET